METEKPKSKRTLIWVALGLTVALVSGGIFITREPTSPFPFLNKYQITERRSSEDGKLKILVLKADVSEVWQDVRNQFGGTRTYNLSGLTVSKGQVTEYRSITTGEGVIKVSNDLTFADDGFGMEINPQHVRPGYCAIAFTRPRTIFDRAMEWMRNTFKGPPKPTSDPPPVKISV
jgi:hypothetical protein